ncbi:MAG: hypothetical protein JW878_02505 [Methanomicrobia archaeon]|nr:hypothetical protein [Methanomicrobia archaeon]
MENRIVLSSVLVLTLFAVTAIPVASATVYYLVPDDSGVEGYGNTIQVQLRLNATQEFQTGKVTIMYESCAAVEGFTYDSEWEFKTPPASYPGEYIITFGNEDEYGLPVNLNAGNYLIGTYTIQCNSTTPCVTDLLFVSSSPHSSTWACDLAALGVPHVPFTTDNGTFACTAPPEPFSKDLVAGWNLISLPLLADDMTVANIIDTSLSGSYDALFRYDAGTHAFVQLASGDTMANGVGYFIHMTAADTWSYTGGAYTSMNIDLSQGLNMPGWLNCTKDITDGLSAIDGGYNYVARWNATTQEFETFNPVAPSVFNDFSELERGEGYFISAKTAGTITEAC